MSLKLKNPKRLKVGQVIEHNWLPYETWTCYSEVMRIEKNGFLLKNLFNYSPNDETFLLHDLTFWEDTLFYDKLEITDILYKKVTDTDRIKKLKPELFL